MKVLVLGAGPVGYLFASLALRRGHQVSVYGRRGAELAFALEPEHPKFADLGGRFELAAAGSEPGQFSHPVDLIVLAVPADQYAGLAQEWLRLHPGAAQACWLLPSAPVGAHRCLGPVREAISLSTFFGASKRLGPGRFSVRGRKRRVYGAGTAGRSAQWHEVQAWFELAGVELLGLASPLAAEARNLTTYVHPALFINRFALSSILRFEAVPPTYMYKLYPEGPITRAAMESMVCLWRELEQLWHTLGLPDLNLLQFLNDDNYPVRPESLSRAEIEAFPHLSMVEQTLLLYIRYTSLLIDPYSEPDSQTGRYHDFSAVPFAVVRRGSGNQAWLPRIPLEDYRTLLLLGQLARRRGLVLSHVEFLSREFEQAVAEFEERHGVVTQLALTADRERAGSLAEQLC